MPLFVLIHSPSVGPSTWSPVAGQLVASGCDAVVPSLLSVGEGGPPFWPRAVAAVAAGLAGTDPGQPLVLVAQQRGRVRAGHRARPGTAGGMLGVRRRHRARCLWPHTYRR